MQAAISNISIAAHALIIFWSSLATTVQAADQQSLPSEPLRQGFRKGTRVPVTCLNRTIDTGEHVSDASGRLQYIPFPICNETGTALTFHYGEPSTITCTIDSLEDELYHLLEFYVHNDVPLTCRIPSYPLRSSPTDTKDSSISSDSSDSATSTQNLWTPLTVALQGTLQLSHLHLQTSINVLIHNTNSYFPAPETSHIIAATAYSLPNLTTPVSVPVDPAGAKIIRGEPLVFTFNVGWIDGSVLPGMVGRPIARVTDHGVGFFLLCLFACLASAGVGGMGVMMFERRKWKLGRGKGLDGLLGGNTASRANGYGGYGGYGGYSSGSTTGKRD